MEVPESVRIGLASIDPELTARWNPQGKQVGGFSFDANGQPRHKVFEGRWEIWHVGQETRRDYRVCQLEDKQGNYIPIGDWAVEMIREINPERFDGDLHKLAHALIDKPNQDVERLSNKEYDNLLDYLADRCWSAKTRHARTTVVGLSGPAKIGV